MTKSFRLQFVLFIRKLINAVIPEVNNLFQIAFEQRSVDSNCRSVNPLNKFGKKCFSQNDEDGITVEIAQRLGITGKYLEFGVGDGLECNTLVLHSLGWKGMWVGDEKLAIGENESKDFVYIRKRVTRENLLSILETGFNHFKSKTFDVISVDLDGNDYYIVEALLKSDIEAKLFIVEYNGKFFPPIEFRIKYDPDFIWRGDDYFGASLQSYVNLFSEYGYTLVCCNGSTGSNAFFVSNMNLENFKDVPSDIASLYVPPMYFEQRRGHPGSARTVEKLIFGEFNF